MLTIYDKVDEKLVLLSSKKIKFSKNLIKYEDTKLYDMYDHNYFHFNDSVIIQELMAAQIYQKNKKLDFLKLYSEYRLNSKFVKIMGLKENVYLTMQFKGNINKIKDNDKVIIKPINLKDLNAIELKHYGKVYGEDFVSRRNKAFIKLAKEDNGFNYYGAYINDKLVGACHTYTYKGYTCFDSLIVDNRYRHRYIASTIIKYIINNSKRTMLHADYDDTPKLMYKKMGFKIVCTNYEYFKKVTI